LYDLAIIGAGINGCSVAYEFTQANKKVILFDMDKIAAGGSGAAGAFIAPKFSKNGELKELLHESFLYAMKYYEKNFKSFFTKTILYHSANDEKSSQNLKAYKQNTNIKLKQADTDFLKTIKPYAKEFESICIDAGVVDAVSTCRAMLEDTKFVKEKVDTLVYVDGAWKINEKYLAKDVLLCTGAYESVIAEEHIGIRGIWGHRISVKTTTENKYALHQDLSISPSRDGVVAIGATHDVHFHPQKNKEPYNMQKGRDFLIQSALKSIDLEDIEVVQDFTGLRSGSSDYMPIVGRVVNSKVSLKHSKQNLNQKKPDYEKFTYYPNLYMLNGNGGYGFVLAPLIAKKLSDFILKDKKVEDRLSPARFFVRWARRLKN